MMLMDGASTQITKDPAPQGGQAELSLSVESYTLDNGLTVLMSHDARLPVVAVEILQRTTPTREYFGA